MNLHSNQMNLNSNQLNLNSNKMNLTSNQMNEFKPYEYSFRRSRRGQNTLSATSTLSSMLHTLTCAKREEPGWITQSLRTWSETWWWNDRLRRQQQVLLHQRQWRSGGASEVCSEIQSINFFNTQTLWTLTDSKQHVHSLHPWPEQKDRSSLYLFMVSLILFKTQMFIIRTLKLL